MQTRSGAQECVFPDNGDLKEGDNGWIGPYDPRCITRKVDDDTTKREPAYEVSAGGGTTGRNRVTDNGL